MPKNKNWLKPKERLSNFLRLLHLKTYKVKEISQRMYYSTLVICLPLCLLKINHDRTLSFLPNLVLWKFLLREVFSFNHRGLVVQMKYLVIITNMFPIIYLGQRMVLCCILVLCCIVLNAGYTVNKSKQLSFSVWMGKKDFRI